VNLGPRVNAGLGGRLVSLVPLRRDHYADIYRIVTHDAIAPLWRFGGTYPTPEAFETTLWQNVLTQFAVDYRSRVAGMTIAYQADLARGFVSIATVVDPALRLSGAGIEATALLVDHVFTTWPMRKVYMEASEASYHQFSSAVGDLCRLEGVLREHDFQQGEYQDKYILATYRSDWKRVRELLGRDPLGSTP
jgi:RimJ/RimL family protein N-acetyltransferase